MTTGDYPPPDPNIPPPPPPGGYPPPPPGYGPPTGYPVPQYGQPGGYTPAPDRPGQPAGLGIRFGARFIDGLVIAAVAALLTALFNPDGSYFGFPGFSIFFPILWGIPAFIYFTACEAWKGWTPGKKLFGLTVRGAGGAARPDFRQAAIRNGFTILGAIPCLGLVLAPIAILVIAITINGSPTKQGKHDELAGGTQVVKS